MKTKKAKDRTKQKKKTHKGISKRIRVTKNGKVMFHGPGKRHLNSSKSRKRKRSLRRYRVAVGLSAKNMARLISR